ncbi:HemK2/MTQ2 family protein methyltransferase [Streptomyces sp. NPDC002795]|uniref:HemK2/MTQ2 family protein methyltransferase n=1 Tax=Streptomyces sp. NPDC002795 TaxID=3364665 RepID=UPI0036A71BAD
MTSPLLTFPGVYAPQDDTWMLADALLREPLARGAEVLDVGTGTGAVALFAAGRGARVTAVDVSWRAVLTARLNARLNRLPLRVLRGDLLAPVMGRRFDLIVANPPYVPAPAARVPRRGAARAWDAGRDGRLVLDRICRAAPPLLRPGGTLLIVQSALSDADRTLDLLRSSGLRADVVGRRSIPFGPVLEERQQWLRRHKLLAADASREGLVVVRAERTD